MRALTRTETLVELLRSLQDFQLDELGTAGDRRDSRVLKHHPLYHQGSYAELERCLHQLRSYAPSNYWHLSERYLRCTRKPTLLQVRKGRPVLHLQHAEIVGGLGSIKTGQARFLVETWNPSVRKLKVEKGLDYVSHAFHGSPFLPREILEVVAA